MLAEESACGSPNHTAHVNQGEKELLWPSRAHGGVVTGGVTPPVSVITFERWGPVGEGRPVPRRGHFRLPGPTGVSHEVPSVPRVCTARDALGRSIYPHSVVFRKDSKDRPSSNGAIQWIKHKPIPTFSWGERPADSKLVLPVVINDLVDT